MPEVPGQLGGLTQQTVALVEVQLILTEVLYGMVIGPSELFALISAVGGGVGEFTVIEALQVLVPAVLLTVRVHVWDCMGLTIALPFAEDILPLPMSPVQLYGMNASASFDELQVTSVCWPCVMVEGLKEREQVGGLLAEAGKKTNKTNMINKIDNSLKGKCFIFLILTFNILKKNQVIHKN